MTAGVARQTTASGVSPLAELIVRRVDTVLQAAHAMVQKYSSSKPAADRLTGLLQVQTAVPHNAQLTDCACRLKVNTFS